MAETAGYGGTLSATGLTVGIKQWTINWTIDPLEVSDYGDSGNATYIAGIKRWSATITANWDITNTITPGTSVAVTFTATTGKYYTGTGIMMNSSPVNDVAGINTITYQFQGTSALVPTLA